MWRPTTAMFLLLMLMMRSDPTTGKLSLKQETSSLVDEKSFSEVVLDKTLDVFAPTSEGVENEVCRRQARLFARGVREGVGWAVQMFDASSKTPFSVISDYGFYVGNYDKCVSIENIPTEEGPINGQHCLVTIGAPTWGSHLYVYNRSLHNVLDIEAKLRLLRDNKKVVDEAKKTTGKAGLVWSLCVPSSCRPRDVRAHLAATLPGLMPHSSSVVVSNIECTSRGDKPPLTHGDWLLGALILTITSLVLFGTWRHSYTDQPAGWIQSFSLIGGARELFSERPQTGSDDKHSFPVLDGIRVLSMLSLFFYHYGFVWEFFPPATKRSFVDDVRQKRSLFNASLHVDTFLVLSGLLVSFNYLRDRQRGANFSLLNFYIQRFARIVPLFWMTILVSQSNLPFYMGEGPLFTLNVLGMQKNCIDTLPQVMLFLGNFIPPERMCALHSWYLAADMQLFCLAPLLIHLLHIRPKIGKAVIVCLLQVSLLIYYLVTLHYPLFYLGLAIGENAAVPWFRPYMRLTPWLVGLGLGYALNSTARGPAHHLSRQQVTACWFVSAGMMITAFWMGPVVLETQDHHTAIVFHTLQKPMWALGVAWVIFACSRGYGGPVSAFLTWRGFILPSRLSFSFYLVHFLVLIYFVASSKTVDELDTAGKVTRLFRDLGLSLLVATMVHLVVELPVINLRKALITASKPSSSVHCSNGKVKVK